jgi:hypothetical protein
MDIVLENYLNSVCCEEIVEPFNFDVTANWATGDESYPVTDQASFETFLSGRISNNLTNIVITDFELINGRLRCNLTADGTILNIIFMSVTEVLGVGNLSSLKFLYLQENQIVTFSPTIALPNSLEQLLLGNSQVENFNPTIALPVSLKELDLRSNKIVTFNPTIALPNGLVELALHNNKIVTFNPSIALPISLEYLSLGTNQMTTASYTTSETWANAQPSFTNGCQVSLALNINSVNGTNLKTILESKNCTVIA